METLYLICAIGGGTLIVCQFLMGLVGLGGEHDVGHDVHIETDHHVGDHHHETSHDAYAHWLVGVLTFRTIVAGLTFFGLAGMVMVRKEVPPLTTLLIALAAGISALFLVAGLMRGLHRLKADGTVHIERAVGTTGSVYLRIPGKKAGTGKVTLKLQNRTVEYQAITAHDELPTGAKVVVVGIVSPDTVEVELAASTERAAHV
jgi:hypothetical protein